MRWPRPELVRFTLVLTLGIVLILGAWLFRITPLLPWLIIGTLVFSIRLWSIYSRSKPD
jgi:hypothetical protein